MKAVQHQLTLHYKCSYYFHVIFSHRDLVISSNKVNLGEDGFTMEAGGEILNMWNGVFVRYGDSIKTTIVPACTPVPGLRFGNHVKWRSPSTGGADNSLVQHMLKLIFSDLESFWWKAPGLRRARWSLRKDVVGDVVFNSSLLGCWSGNVWILAEEFRERSWRERSIDRTKSWYWRSNTVNTKVGYCVNKAACV